VLTSQLDGAPFNLHAHWTGVVVDLRDAAENLGVDFCADGFGEVLRELWILDLAREGLFHAECCSFVEFCTAVSMTLLN
jgi:hypothetical protein